jgi:putative ATP-dependent endonuclease of OLD family
LNDPQVDTPTRNHIKDLLGDTDDVARMEEEAIRYLLWLDSERCCAFFADIVLICEGAAEKSLIDYLIKNEWNEIREKRIYVLDAMGKFNIHRYMNLFEKLGIYHSVLIDRDEDKKAHRFINPFIESRKNSYTKSIDFFYGNIETFLGIKKVQSYKKPLNVMWNYFKGNICKGKIEELKEKVLKLL